MTPAGSRHDLPSLTHSTILIAFVQNGRLETDDALEVLTDLRDAQIWEENGLVTHVEVTLIGELD